MRANGHPQQCLNAHGEFSFLKSSSLSYVSVEHTPPRILDLGSGPGFLAQYILEAIPSAQYTMLDFSQAMHDLARERLGPLMKNVRPVLADFKHDS